MNSLNKEDDFRKGMSFAILDLWLALHTELINTRRFEEHHPNECGIEEAISIVEHSMSRWNISHP